MPEELTAPKAPRKELGLDDSRSNTPQGFVPAGGHKGQGAAAAALSGKNGSRNAQNLCVLLEIL